MHKVITLHAFTLCSCGGLSETKEPTETQSCSIDARFIYPDGSVSTYSDCEDVVLDATYEFDPDTAPEIRSFNIQFSGTDDASFNCWLKVTAQGICGSGRYDVGSAASTRVEFETSDCVGVTDEYEGKFAATSGVHTVYRANAGDQPGNFEGESLYTNFRGSLSATTPEGIQVEVSSYVISAYIRGMDAEEAPCLNQD